MAFKSPEEIRTKAAAYFAGRDAKGAIYTMTGLAMALGVNRETLWEYASGMATSGNAEIVENKRPFTDAVKECTDRVRVAWEELLAGRTPVGAIFWLKNHGWADRVEQDVTSNGQAIAPNVVMFGTGDPLKRRIEQPRARLDLDAVPALGQPEAKA